MNHKIELDLVPPEVGPQLRRLYPNQPFEDLLLVGMEPIRDSGGEPSIFVARHNGFGKCLYAYCGNSDRYWKPEDRWVFARRTRARG